VKEIKEPDTIALTADLQLQKRQVRVVRQVDAFEEDGLRDILYLVIDFLKAIGFREDRLEKHIKAEVFEDDE
jgi:hypothetical protein